MVGTDTDEVATTWADAFLRDLGAMGWVSFLSQE